MTNITISNATRSIELSKKFAAAAAKFGSDEYKMLQEARRDYPDYKVVEISRKNPKSNKSTFKGLTYEYHSEKSGAFTQHSYLWASQ